MRITGASALAVLATLVGTPASPALAQSIPSPYRYVENGQEAGLFVASFGGDEGRFGFAPSPGLLFGGRYGLELSGPLALEGVVSFVPTTRDVVNPRRVEGDRVVGEADVKLLMVDARLRFTLTGRRTWNGISPYLVVGGGLARDMEGDQREDQFLEEGDRFDFGTEFTGVLGGGLRWVLSDSWAVRGDASMSLYKIDVPDGWGDPDLELENVPDGEWVNSSVLSVGVSWLF